LTLTTPSLAVGGRGTAGLNSTRAGLDVDGDGTPDDYLAAGYEDRLAADFRTPFSIAAGMTFKIEKVRVYWSTEWFAPLKPYAVVRGGEFTPQSGGPALSTRFKGYSSFTTDYSSKRAGTMTNLAMTDWDIFHAVTGSEIKFSKSSLTFGLGYSFGRRAFGERPEILPPGGFAGLWDPFSSLKFRYAIYRAIVGFAF
jgi:hypothetical protein